MIGEGRESKKDNDLFYTCSLIDYIARKTKNTRADVVNKLGKQRIDKIYDLADVYHCDNIDRVSDDFIEEAGIQEGNFDNVGECKYSIPSHWDIGKVYKRLIKMVAADENIGIVDALKKYTIPSSVQKLMTTTAVYITKIRHIYLNRIGKTECCKRNG